MLCFNEHKTICGFHRFHILAHDFCSFAIFTVQLAVQHHGGLQHQNHCCEFRIKNSCYSYIQWQFHRRRFQQLYLAQNSDSCMKNKTTPSNKHISLFNNINQLFTYSKGPSLHLRDHTKCFIHQQGPQVQVDRQKIESSRFWKK